MCVIRKPLPSPDSLQLPVLSYSHTVNVGFYWFSSPTVSLLSLFLPFFAFFYETKHFPLLFPEFSQRFF